MGERDAMKRVVRAGYDRAASSYLAARPTDGADVDLLADLSAQIPAPASVLDLGCGAGAPVTSGLVDRGFDVVGLDFSTVQLALAKEEVRGVALVAGDVTALPFSPRSFDAVVSYYTIIHVPRDEHAALVREVGRVLRPGGGALLCLGATDLPSDYDPSSWLGVPMYWSHFDRDANLRLLADAGLGVDWARLVPDPMGHGGHLFVLVRAGGGRRLTRES